MFRFRTPEGCVSAFVVFVFAQISLSFQDSMFVEQILISGATVGKSENRKGNCFKVEKVLFFPLFFSSCVVLIVVTLQGKEKLVFMANDNWDQATWIIQLEKFANQQPSRPADDELQDKSKKKRFSFGKK